MRGRWRKSERRERGDIEYERETVRREEMERSRRREGGTVKERERKSEKRVRAET